MILGRRSFLGTTYHAARKAALSLCPQPSAPTVWTLQGAQTTLHASSAYGAAVYSLVWQGFEFVNSSDLGREIQTAYQLNGQGENYNPTEAGSSGAAGNVPSQILSADVTGKIFNSSVYPAFWNKVGGQSYSPDTISKRVEIDYNGIINLVRHDVTVVTAQDYNLGLIEGLTGYMVGALQTLYVLNDDGTVSLTAKWTDELPITIADPGTEYQSTKPLILTTADKAKAFGIYSPLSGYSVLINSYGSGTNKWDAARQSKSPWPKGSYSWTVYYVVGTLADVQAKLIGV